MEPHGWTVALAGVENFFLANAALSVAAFLVARTLRARGLARTWRPRRRARLYAAALAAPPIVSGWLVCASLLPAVWLDEARWQRAHEPAHSLHLLNAFTLPLDPMLGYAALSFTLLAALVAAHAAWGMYFRVGSVIERLEVGAEPAAAGRVAQVEAACRGRGIAVGLVVSNYPFSFVWGYWRSKLVVSTGLLNALTAGELAGVLEHEAAHHARRDNVARVALTVCRYLSPAFPLTGLLYRWWGEQVEMICDELSARETGAPVELASALVRLRRLTSAQGPSLRAAGAGVAGNAGDDFERRVRRVLSLADPRVMRESDPPRSCVRAAALTAAAFAMSLGALFACSPLAVHKIVEMILHQV